MDSTQASTFPFDWTYPAAFCWGLLVLASLVGWGQAVGFYLLPNREEREFGWGLAAAWGMSAYLALSGPMVMLALFGKTFVTAFILAGLAFAAWHFRLFLRRCLSSWPRPWGVQVLLVGLLLLITLHYAGAVAIHWYNSSDDFAAYFTHAKMLLDTGTLYDPFDFRLMGSLEGQQTLSVLVLGFLPWKYAQLLDSGIAGLILLGLVQGMVRGNSTPAWIARLILVSLALTAYVPRVNSASEVTGVVFFTALFGTFNLVSRHRSAGWKSALLMAGVMAATATLRCNYVYTTALLAVGFIVLRVWEGEMNRRDILRETLLTLAGVIALLSPWWAVAYRGCGTFLYPLFKGNQPANFNSLQGPPMALSGELFFIGGFFFSTAFLLFFLPIIFIAAGRQRRAAVVYGGALLLISFLLISHYTLGYYEGFSRYLDPIGLAFGLYFSGVIAQQIVTTSPFKGSAFSMMRALVAIMVAATVVFLQGFGFYNVCCGNIQLIEWALDARNNLTSTGVVDFYDEARDEYPKAFAQIPPGARILTALDYPFLLDYRVHQSFRIDDSGETSPPPGFPYFQGPEPVKKYLLALGIRYIAHVPFDRSGFLYSRYGEIRDLMGSQAGYRLTARYGIDFMNNIDRLAKSNRILYDSPTIRVIDLGD